MHDHDDENEKSKEQERDYGKWRGGVNRKIRVFELSNEHPESFEEGGHGGLEEEEYLRGEETQIHPEIF